MRLGLCPSASLLAAALASTACSHPSSGGCATNADCKAGAVCVSGVCQQLCVSDADCHGKICVKDICTPGTRSDVPEVTTVDADGSPDGAAGHFANHVHRILTIHGQHFDGAQVTLQSGGSKQVLEICQASSEQLVVSLPDSITPGDYVLSVASQAGACNTNLGVLQGETGPTGPTGPAGVPCTDCVGTNEVTDGSLTGADIAPNASLNVGAVTTTGAVTAASFVGPLGATANNPATSCAALHTARSAAPDGIYWLHPSTSSIAFQSYCDMTTDGGGWTLVWSNLRGTRGKPMTELPWAAAINTPPRYSGTPSAELDSFIVYTGLAHWEALAPGGKLRYSWAHDYGSPIDQSYACSFSFDNTSNTYNLDLTNCSQLQGTVVPGLYSDATSNGSAKPAFSTYDADHDATSTANCGSTYTQTPWWYTSCWSGSINGGGEDEGNGYYNGAYWIGSDKKWATGDGTGTGAGNGWIFVK